ncbi:hypothetical protein M3Y97_00637300 [Aphelenchoides bicaudatus]|nr:hypothetical protein M3Y97_00637300 [Aphelenchoides bicaudatus]
MRLKAFKFTEKQEALLQEALLLLGEGQGDAVAFLKKRDPELAKVVSTAFTSVEKKLDGMSKESIKFIAQLMDYLRTSPDNLKPDKNGNPQVPKEVHEISLVSSWSQLDSKTKTEVQSLFPSIAKTLKSAEFKEHARNEMNKHGWTIN